jgi:hypothetical protein
LKEFWGEGRRMEKLDEKIRKLWVEIFEFYFINH